MATYYTIYKHISPNGKMYIGITNQKTERRWRNGDGYIKNTHFTNAISKYGWNNIKHEIIAHSCSEWLAKAMEKHIIAEYKTYDRKYGYNKTFGGEGNIPTEETKKKLSKAMIGKFAGENNPMYGKTSAMYGKHHSEESKKKMSISISENHADVSGENNPNAKEVILLNTGEIFSCMQNASIKYNVEPSSISKCCNKKYKSAGKLYGEPMIWVYRNNLNKEVV